MNPESLLAKRTGGVMASVVVRVFSGWFERHGYEMQRLEPSQLRNKQHFYVAIIKTKAVNQHGLYCNSIIHTTL